jgi:hypothetical protein
LGSWRRAREWLRSPACCSSWPPRWAYALAAGCRSPAGVGSALARRRRSSGRSRPSRRRGGDCVTRCVGKARGTSTRAIAPTGVGIVIETKCQELRGAPSRPGARAGGMAVPPPAKVGPPRRCGSAVPRSCSWSAAVGARRAGGLDRSLGDAQGRGGHRPARRLVQPLTRLRPGGRSKESSGKRLRVGRPLGRGPIVRQSRKSPNAGPAAGGRAPFARTGSRGRNALRGFVSLL